MSELLKKEDIVVISGASSYEPEYLARVTRATHATVWIGQKNGNGMVYERKFRQSGREIGSTFHASYVRLATEDDIARIKNNQKRARIIAAIKRADLASRSTDELEAAHNILCPSEHKAAEEAASECERR